MNNNTIVVLSLVSQYCCGGYSEDGSSFRHQMTTLPLLSDESFIKECIKELEHFYGESEFYFSRRASTRSYSTRFNKEDYSNRIKLQVISNGLVDQEKSEKMFQKIEKILNKINERRFKKYSTEVRRLIAINEKTGEIIEQYRKQLDITECAESNEDDAPPHHELLVIGKNYDGEAFEAETILWVQYHAIPSWPYGFHCLKPNQFGIKNLTTNTVLSVEECNALLKNDEEGYRMRRYSAMTTDQQRKLESVQRDYLHKRLNTGIFVGQYNEYADNQRENGLIYIKGYPWY
ncbi:MAG: hypothetical protein HYW78_03745 [Parcubacteria group bacterium]|nr:hypothetical protein [Parcubacteria group bacterium]